MSNIDNNVIYEIPINIDKDNLIIINDIIRMSTIQIIAHILFSITDPSVNFLSTLFIKTLIFIIIGVATYWLFVKKFIRFTSSIDNKKDKNVNIEYANIF